MTLNYLERVALYNPTHIMIMVDLVAISVETPRIDSGCSLKKEFIELICIYHLMVIIHKFQSS